MTTLPSESPSASTSSTPSSPPIINYDTDGYDYRSYWNGRSYENWAERRVIRRWLAHQPPIDWLVDLGGGFGRNIPLYLQYAHHVVLADYSWTNLTNAASTLLANPANSGRVFLLRVNLYHTPFRDAAFDVGMTVRVLHHLIATDAALAEMGRAIGSAWLLDVPSRHHLLAQARLLAHGKRPSYGDHRPLDIGTPEEPYMSYDLGVIRQELTRLGWSSRLVASVANFRRWERVVPRPAQPLARPIVYGAEVVGQQVGRGWWGPSQWLGLTRPRATLAAVAPQGDAPEEWRALAPRLWCPSCHSELTWSAAGPRCAACQRDFEQRDHIIDFVVS